MPYQDGPPWTVGQNCNITLQHAAVNANVPTGFYIKPDSWRVFQPRIWYPGMSSRSVATVATPIAPGKRVIEGIVVASAGQMHGDSGASMRPASQIYNAWIAYHTTVVNQAMSLVDPQGGAAYNVIPDSWEARLAPLGGQFLLRWELFFTYLVE